MALSPGTRLGPYEIQSLIGAGGMGEVYKARDTRLDRSVAIKVLPPAFSADPERRARFEREAKTVAGLSHPHICPLFDVGDHDGATYLVMERLTGETLAQRLQKGPLPLEQALTVATEIADALAAAHRQGVVVIEAVIGADGQMAKATVLRSVPLLDQAALDAVKQWEFSPSLLNGKPVPVVMTVTVNLKLQ